jgi:hypothetical protein
MLMPRLCMPTVGGSNNRLKARSLGTNCPGFKVKPLWGQSLQRVVTSAVDENKEEGKAICTTL